MITLVYDTQLRRPGCALIQAAYGCDHDHLHRFFDSNTWLNVPTPGMRRIRGTREEWERAAKLPPRGPVAEGGSQ